MAIFGKRKVYRDEVGEGTDLGGGGTEEIAPAAGATDGPDLAAAATEISESLFGKQEPAEGEPDPVGEVVDLEAKAAEPAPAAATPPADTPKTWRPEAAAKWASVDPVVQQEILKREEDIFKGLEALKPSAQIGDAVKQIFEPYMPALTAAGINPLNQLQSLMAAHYTLATGTIEQKQALFMKLAADYGLQDPGEKPFVDPTVSALQKQVTDLQSRLQGRETQEASAARAKIDADITAFASDPAHPHFNEVANDIAALLRGGVKTLQEAYDKAIWANPATRAKEQARLSAEAAQKAEKERVEKVAAAKKATGANVKSKAKAASGTAPLGSIDDTLQAALTKIKSRP